MPVTPVLGGLTPSSGCLELLYSYEKIHMQTFKKIKPNLYKITKCKGQKWAPFFPLEREFAYLDPDWNWGEVESQVLKPLPVHGSCLVFCSLLFHSTCLLLPNIISQMGQCGGQRSNVFKLTVDAPAGHNLLTSLLHFRPCALSRLEALPSFILSVLGRFKSCAFPVRHSVSTQ